jgi:5-methylcytosine-specific restriction protein B
MLERKRQVILYGPPGTGKTYHAERVAQELVARHNFGRAFAALTQEQRRQIDGSDAEAPFVESCTFHPMYSYEDFIEGYRPDGESFSLQPGIFKRMATAAAAMPDKKFVLIIDEINRGNIPRIFGELITLVEASKRGKSYATLPLSEERFSVPDNMYLIGTMNTADRSILLLDTALRRRFAFKELMPQPAVLKGGSIGDVSLSAWLRALNRRVVAQLGRDGRNLQIGHAYLMTTAGKPISKRSRIGEVLRDEIWPLLQEYCYEDPRKLENILGELYDPERANLHFELFEPGQEEELTRALIAVLTPEDKTEDAALGEDLIEDEEEHP